MIGLLQRVTRASVRVDGRLVGEIGPGLLVLLCAERGDGARQAAQLTSKILGLRIFADDEGKMNRNVRDVGGGLLLVPQFTLAADTRSGMRPSFTPAAPPAVGRVLFDECVALARAAHPHVATGEFGAMMQVELVNDGPVTIWLRIQPDSAGPASKEASQ